MRVQKVIIAVLLLIVVTTGSLMAKNGAFVNVNLANEFFETRTTVEQDFTGFSDVAETLSNGGALVLRNGLLTTQFAVQYSDNKIDPSVLKMVEMYVNGGITLPLGELMSFDLTMGTNFHITDKQIYYLYSNIKAGADIYIGRVDFSCFAQMLSPVDSTVNLVDFYSDENNQLLKFGVGIGYQLF